MLASKVTEKYQATIPQEVRKLLRLKAGDSIAFQITNNGLVLLQKSKSIDKEYLKALNELMTEWESDYDDNDFKHLQDL